MTTLNVPEDQMRIIASKALYEVMEPVAREKVIADAIAQVILPVPAKDSWSKPGPSPLNVAFDKAMCSEVDKLVKEHVARPEVQEQLKSVIEEAFSKFMSQERDNFMKLIVNAMGQSISSVSYKLNSHHRD